MTALLFKPLLYCYMLLGMLAPKTAAPTHAFHPLHVSTSDISYNSQSGKFEAICTIFTDDFEAALARQYQIKIDLSKPEMHTAMDAVVKRYVLTNLHLKSNGVNAPLNYVGYEIDRESVKVYVESDKAISPKKVDAEVTLLHNQYNDQINIVHITVNGTRKSGKLDFPAKAISQTF